jgi:hypothetical protein
VIEPFVFRIKFGSIYELYSNQKLQLILPENIILFRSVVPTNNAKVDYSFRENPFLYPDEIPSAVSIPKEMENQFVSPSRLDNFPFPTGFHVVNEEFNPNQMLCIIKRVRQRGNHSSPQLHVMFPLNGHPQY